MNVVTAVVKQLKSDGAVVAAAAAGVYKHRLELEVDGTGGVAVVIAQQGSWRKQTSTASFPRVQVLIHADPTRDGSGRKTKDDAHDRALAAWAAVDRILHRVTRETVIFGGASGLRIVGTEREVEPSFANRPGDTVVMLNAIYDMKVG